MDICERLTARGAKYGIIETQQMRFDPAFRDICKSNACGYYGACWTCPPDAGEIEALMERVQGYASALVFQTVHPLEDSFDIEGMNRASRIHNALVLEVQTAAKEQYGDCLVLGAGACGVCEQCTRRENKPCRFPERAVLSLEACGVDATHLARLAGLPYGNGLNTVTYFGALLTHAAPE